jgi:hypothetical protein
MPKLSSCYQKLGVLHSLCAVTWNKSGLTTICSIGFNGIHEIAQVCMDCSTPVSLQQPSSYLLQDCWDHTEESSSLASLEAADIFNSSLSTLVDYQKLSDDSMLWHHKKQKKGTAAARPGGASECPGRWSGSRLGTSMGTVISVSGSGGGYQGPSGLYAHLASQLPRKLGLSVLQIDSQHDSQTAQCKVKRAIRWVLLHYPDQDGRIVLMGHR